MNKKRILTLASLMLLSGVSIADAKTGFYVGAEGGVNFLRLRLEGIDELNKSRAGDFGIFAGYSHQYSSTFYLGFQVGGGKINFAKKKPESLHESIPNLCGPFLKTDDLSMTPLPNPKYYYNAEMHIGYSILPKMLFYGLFGIEEKVLEFGNYTIKKTTVTWSDKVKKILPNMLMAGGITDNLEKDEVLNFSSDMTTVANVSGKDETIGGFNFPKTDMKKTNVLVGVLGLGVQYSITQNMDVGCAVKAKLGFKNKIKISDSTIKYSHFPISERFENVGNRLITSSAEIKQLIGDYDIKTYFNNLESTLKNEAEKNLKEIDNDNIELKIRVIDYSVALSLRYRF